ncbi:MAG: hypothetical protein Q8R83_08700, partial [Legionellaceae bacterium]|nr:hypothetical protein [Legionellaceae bacterium]
SMLFSKAIHISLMFMTPCPFLAEKIWIINESVSYFNKSDAPTKVARLLRCYAPRNDGFKNRTVQR